MGPLASLNSSFTVGDEPAAVTENLARIARAAEVEAPALLTVSQVHQDTVVRARAPGPGQPAAEADALWTDDARQAVGVRTADCVPILVEDRVGRRVAAVHAGWRGVLLGVLERTLRSLEAQGTRLEDVRLAIGPCAQKCCFEVDGPLPDQFAQAFGAQVVVPVPGKAKVHLDLPAALAVAAARLGVGPKAVAALPHCTMCDTRFYSHRRDRGVTGRHLSFITCRFP